MITVKLYNDGNDNRGKVVGEFGNDRAARKAAAEALGRSTLRGASQWPTETGVVYQFGRHADTERNPCAELIYE